MSNDTEKPTEPPLYAPIFFRRYIEAGKRTKAELARIRPEAQALVLCGPECPWKLHFGRADVEHAHTYWDMMQMAGKAGYECELRAAREAAEHPRVDVRGELKRAGVGVLHIDRLVGLTDKPGKYGDFTVTPAMAGVLRAARRWWNQPRPVLPPDGYGHPASEGRLPRPWLVLLGAAGTWKTQAAVECMAAYFRRNGRKLGATGDRTLAPAAFFSAPELLTMDTFCQAGQDTLRELARTPFLVLDDVSKVAREKGGTHALGVLWRMLDSRYRDARYTILTDNLNAADFKRVMDFAGIAPPEDEKGPLWRRCKELGHVVQAGKDVRVWIGDSEIKA